MEIPQHNKFLPPLEKSGIRLAMQDDFDLEDTERRGNALAELITSFRSGRLLLRETRRPSGSGTVTSDTAVV
jgi:hypothetical protein